ncbi:MAG: DUF2782 domain-containing protein [Mariprofundaceae bacterium]
MHKTYFSFLSVVSLLATLSVAPLAFADEDILPPPTKIHDSEEAHETIDSATESADLNRELSPSEKVEGSEVHSYMRKDGAKITEYSVRGKVYMLRVQPGNNLPAYYLYDDTGNGKFERRLPGGYRHLSPPMWVIKQF